MEINTDIDRLPLNSRKLDNANDPSMVLKNLVKRMIDQNTIVTLDIVNRQYFFFKKRTRTELGIKKENPVVYNNTTSTIKLS